jgi:hypothetical protein
MLSADIKSRGSKEQITGEIEAGLLFALRGEKIDRCEIEAVTVRDGSSPDAPIAEGRIAWVSESGEQSPPANITLIGENGAWKLQE